MFYKNFSDIFSDMRHALFHLANSIARVWNSEARYFLRLKTDYVFEIFCLNRMDFSPQLCLCKLDQLYHPLLKCSSFLKTAIFPFGVLVTVIAGHSDNGEKDDRRSGYMIACAVLPSRC